MDSSEPRLSSTIVVTRDGDAGLEVLLLERSGDRKPWVFPGGKLDGADWAGGGGEGVALRRAAVREAREEAGLALDPDALLLISRWITPKISPKRFDTFFYLANVPASARVRVDGGEIASHRWLAPRAALAAHHASEIRLAPPTFVSVTWLASHADTGSAARALATDDPITFRPRIHPIEEGACMLYPGDSGYEAGDLSLPGPRHRLLTRPQGWEYVRS
jgi:8-oxo-dGTP pyrophosphatase MutT (NUDIX family)